VQHQQSHHDAANHYRNLAIMLLLSFVSMFILMYAMVDAFSNVYGNANQAYMAALMTAPMGVIEIVLMRPMYNNPQLNRLIVVLSVVVLLGSWLAIRQQLAVGNAQFLRSMIPHHAGAVLMCREAPIDDAEIRALCGRIIASQEAEITLMKAKLAQLQ
jgi:uncharacterized protein (DUF305 family)